MANPNDFDGSLNRDNNPDTSELDPADSPSHENEDAEGGGDEGDEPKVTLSTEQLEDCGLSDLEPGDAFTVTLHGTVTDKNDDEGVTCDIDKLTDGMIEGALPAEPKAKPKMPLVRQGPQIKGPAAAGLMTSSPMLPNDEQ